MLNNINPVRPQFDDFGQQIFGGLIVGSGPSCLNGSIAGIRLLVIERVIRMAKMELGRDPPQCFRMTEEQKSARAQRLPDATNHATGRFAREVHQHIATKDQVAGQRRPERRVFIDQVALLEAHHLLDLRRKHEVRTVCLKIAPPAVLRCRPQRPFGVAGLGRLDEDHRVDVNANDLHIPIIEIGQGLAHHDGQ